MIIKALEEIILDQEQENFVVFQQGCAVLQAPVGTGKTLVLAERAAEAIKRGKDAGDILCLTFTNRAADELRQRVTLKCGMDARSVVVRTFHSLCAWILRNEAKQIGLPADFVIYDDDDSLDLIRDCAKSLRILLKAEGRLDQARQALNLITDAKILAPRKTLAIGATAAGTFADLLPNQRHLALTYQSKLAEHHALDYADLIYLTRAMLYTRRDIYLRWAKRFKFIQVDEMQDTHLSEYLILRILAQGSKNMVLVGDFDQTIYQWRGSNPAQVLDLFERDFPRVLYFSFNTNYRTTKVLARAARHVLSHYSDNAGPGPAQTAKVGAPIVCHIAVDADEEAAWIAQKILDFGLGVNLSRIGVLTRTNSRAAAISSVFGRFGIAHITVEQFEFFKRQEVKDAIAYLKLLFNPFDGQSLQRVLRRPSRKISRRALEEIRNAFHLGLRLTDLVQTRTLELGDPFSQLLTALSSASLVIFDTETTGLNPARDEIVEIAALRLDRGEQGQIFHRYLRNGVPVGETRSIHGHSDSFLDQVGEEPAQVLSEFLAFIGDSYIVGHNVSFDIRMLTANARRHGLAPPIMEFADTLDIARRFLNQDSFTLENLAARLNFRYKPTHRAMDDVMATWELLTYLVPYIKEQQTARTALIEKIALRFLPLATEIEAMRAMAGDLRPHQLLANVLEQSGLRAYYTEQEHRRRNLEELLAIFEKRDEIDLDPISSLENLLHFATLARNIDRMDPEAERVRILTVHQSKGLEFDQVFVAGLAQGEFPSYMALKDGKEEEELRVFYVALTRARSGLHLSGYRRYKEWLRKPSPYFGFIGDEWVEEGSNVLEPLRRNH